MDRKWEARLPSENVLAAFQIQAVAPLGGRLNLHWLADWKGRQVVLRRWWRRSTAEEIDYELRLLQSIARLGWPVAPAIREPVEMDGHLWGLFPYVPGDPPSAVEPQAEQRARGRLLAQFHADLARLDGFGQRAGWRRCEAVLGDSALDRLLDEQERTRTEEVRILRWHLDRALTLQERPGIVIHGDFTPWNLRFVDGRLSGILDFELAHWDHRVGDFALSWRGKYDEIVHGYDEVSPLAPEEWEMLTPVWWAFLIDSACRHLAEGTRDDGWNIRKLLQRSPLMGRDSAPYR